METLHLCYEQRGRYTSACRSRPAEFVADLLDGQVHFKFALQCEDRLMIKPANQMEGTVLSTDPVDHPDCYIKINSFKAIVNVSKETVNNLMN